MDRTDRASGFAGGAVIALFIVGVTAFAFSGIALFQGLNLTAAGICLIAAALAFGFLASALLRR